MQQEMACSKSNFLSMFLYAERYKTFEGWPYKAEDGAKCTGEKLAHSGFFRPSPESEPDLARCFMCHKDLEGWEPSDNPETEHRSHSSKCPFLSIKVRDMRKMKVKDYVKLLYNMKIQLVLHTGNAAIKELKDQKENALEDFKTQVHE